jgi:D-sedoheptulose 7-phosphate isomerase
MSPTASVPSLAQSYFDTLAQLLRLTAVSDHEGGALSLDEGFDRVSRAAREAHEHGGKIMFIGNGGSAAISSHLAIDYLKNGGFRATAFNDPAVLTALGNDFGYDKVFAKQLELHAHPGDMLVAISSSGRSPNILSAVEVARTSNCRVATFSGFSEENELRRCGDVNFYVRSAVYGFVEVAHLALCHASFDIAMGWRGGT